MITLETLNTTWYPSRELGLTKYAEFDKWIAQRFVHLYCIYITQQLRKRHWKPLSPKYLAYKKRHALSTRIWEATGELKKALKLKTKNRTHFYIGFDNRYHIKSKAKKKPKIKYLTLSRIHEFGSVVNHIPPRPLFRPILWYMKAHLKRLYIEFTQGVQP